MSPIVNLFSGQNSPGNISATIIYIPSINNIGNLLQFPKRESVANFSHYSKLLGTSFSLVEVLVAVWVNFSNARFTSGNEAKLSLGYKCRQQSIYFQDCAHREILKKIDTCYIRSCPFVVTSQISIQDLGRISCLNTCNSSIFTTMRKQQLWIGGKAVIYLFV